MSIARVVAQLAARIDRGEHVDLCRSDERNDDSFGPKFPTDAIVPGVAVRNLLDSGLSPRRFASNKGWASSCSQRESLCHSSRHVSSHPQLMP